MSLKSKYPNGKRHFFTTDMDALATCRLQSAILEPKYRKPGAPPVLCWAFRMGKCNRGDRCALSHKSPHPEDHIFKDKGDALEAARAQYYALGCEFHFI